MNHAENQKGLPSEWTATSTIPSRRHHQAGPKLGNVSSKSNLLCAAYPTKTGVIHCNIKPYALFIAAHACAKQPAYKAPQLQSKQILRRFQACPTGKDRHILGTRATASCLRARQWHMVQSLEVCIFWLLAHYRTEAGRSPTYYPSGTLVSTVCAQILSVRAI